MISVEERVAYLVGRVEGQSHMMDDIRDSLRGFESRMDRRFEAVDRRFEVVDRRFDALDSKMSRQFLWLVGLSVTTLATMAAGFAALAATLAGR